MPMGQVTFTGAPPFTFNGYQFSDVDGTIPDITGVTLDPANTTLAGFSQTFLDFDQNSLRINFPDSFNWPSQDLVTLDVTFAGPAPPPAPACAVSVPSTPPAAFALLVTVLLAGGAYLVRLRQARG